MQEFNCFYRLINKQINQITISAFLKCTKWIKKPKSSNLGVPRTIGVRAPLDLAARRPYCPKKITQCPKTCVVQTHSNCSPILTSNERIMIPNLQLNPNFSNLRRKRKLVRKMGYFEKSGVTKITVSDRGEGNDRLLVRVIRRFEKSGSHCSYFS